jgi:hypothetical protein
MDLNRLTIHELQEKIRAGETTATDIVRDVFTRIDAVEQDVHAYISLMKDDAFDEASRADADIRAGNLRPLTGIPVALKDILCTKGFLTTCGSHILHNYVPPYNAAVVEKLNDAIRTVLASADLAQIARIIDGVNKNFLVYSGNDADTFPILGLGGYGVIGVITHLVGKQYKQMMDDFFDGRVAESARLHRHFMPLVNTMFMIGSPMPIKYALNYLGFRVGKPRLPLVVPDEKTRAAIEQTLKSYKIDLPVK